MRPSGRAPDDMRDIKIETDISRYAEGSCIIHFGHTKVMCTASVEDGVPPFLKGTGKGWVTAEYGMLPRSTHDRMDRKRAAGSGRTQEIQRLIGRSLRAVTDLGGFGERQVKVDCDVLQADGGTRTASITGGFVALHMAFQHIQKMGAIETIPLTDYVAAVSCGLWSDTPVLDLDYDEDSSAQADANFVLTGSNGIVEIQGTAEDAPFSRDEFNALLDLAEKGIGELVGHQKKALGIA
ncbi:ribonuclease PH [Hwanghaeella sp.]|uniref:ribonuclease PH n=1 Tax=Hwanghaeella sp. TaxID=2605943 RepID=UPI003CCBFAC1